MECHLCGLQRSLTFFCAQHTTVDFFILGRHRGAKGNLWTAVDLQTSRLPLSIDNNATDFFFVFGLGHRHYIAFFLSLFFFTGLFAWSLELDRVDRAPPPPPSPPPPGPAPSFEGRRKPEEEEGGGSSLSGVAHIGWTTYRNLSALVHQNLSGLLLALVILFYRPYLIRSFGVTELIRESELLPIEFHKKAVPANSTCQLKYYRISFPVPIQIIPRQFFGSVTHYRSPNNSLEAVFGLQFSW